MSKHEFDELWDEFNTLETEDLLHYSNIGILSRLSQISTEDKKDVIEKELDLGWTIHIISNWLEHFEPDFNKAKEVIEKFTNMHKNDLDYYQTRLNETKTTLLKWHYSLACYFLIKHDYLLDAIKLIIKSSKLALTSQNYLNCVQLLVMAYHLNIIYGLKLDNEINREALDILEKLKENPRYLIEPSELIARIGIVKEKTLSEIINLLISKAEKEIRDHIFESLLNVAIKLCNLERKTELKNSIILKIAQRFEELGDKQTEGLLMIHHYEKAQKEYQKLNDDKKITELSEKIRQSYDKIEWQVIEHKFELPELTIPGKNGFEKVQSIANFADMIPSIDKTKQLTKELRNKYSISSLFPSTSFNKKQPTSHNVTDEEIEKSQLKTEFIRTIRMMESILSINVKKLEDNKEIKINDYFDYIDSFGLFDKTSLAIIKCGIERHFSEDYISSIHILIPQVEYTIRELLRSRGVKTTRIDGDTIRNLLLDSLISRGVDLYGEDMVNYLKIKFTDMDGLNERNNICHADTDISDFSHPVSLSIIYVIMIISKLALI